MKKTIKLSQIKVKSFVTSLKNDETKTVNGGQSGDVCTWQGGCKTTKSSPKNCIWSKHRGCVSNNLNADCSEPILID